jgi:hypothetical protein
MVLFFMQAASAQEGTACTMDFTIYTAESIEAQAGTTVDIELAVKNTGTCTASARIVKSLPEGWSGSNYTTPTLTPGDNDVTTLEINIPSDAENSTINFTAAGGTKQASVEVIVTSENQTPVITPAPAPIITPQEPQPKQQENTTPQAEQPESSVTGLVTSNPAVQSIVLFIIVFGAGYLLGKGKGEGFRYRFRR